MQKFTRALTREVEVGGERLAFTFDADGLTVRPVGSRRPPRQLDWPAVVRAITGEAALDDALAALKGGQPTKTEAATPASLVSKPSAELPELLRRLDDWLAKHRERYHEALPAGATAGELDSLAKTIGQSLPAELETWLKWHNGQPADLIGGFWEAFHLMSAAQIAAAWQDRSARGEPGWDSRWIPFLDDYQDDLLVLDPMRLGMSVREVWRGREDQPIVAESLTAWVERFVGDVVAGHYHEDPERGEFRQVKT